MRALGIAATVLAIFAAAAQAQSVELGSGDAVSVAAGTRGAVYSVTRERNRLTTCSLKPRATRCTAEAELPSPDGDQAGVKILRRRGDGALFVFDGRETGSLWVHRSDDDGVTWNEPVLVATDLPGLGDAALTSDGRHADVIADDVGSYARVSLDGEPVQAPFLNLAFGLARSAAMTPSLASLGDGSVVAAFGELPAPGTRNSTVDFGIRHHASGGDLRVAREWSLWSPALDVASVFGAGNSAFAIETRTLGALRLHPISRTGRLRKGEPVWQGLTGSGAVGALSATQPRQVHLAVAQAGGVAYTRTDACGFLAPMTATATNPFGLAVAAPRATLGFAAWAQEDGVRASWFASPDRRVAC